LPLEYFKLGLEALPKLQIAHQLISANWLHFGFKTQVAETSRTKPAL
jgi:hypothetical protein